MRLSKIKLAGFKSFVDPTVLGLPSNLVGIVGPNGCGKSNVIDAVRWVMGESSAKHLRGDSMADVIFNGSTSRKPVGQAAIELVFDNSDGALGGQYAQYNEISVRRQVVRDGQSAYFLNGTRCRRRDITDVFLGTGLGPRSYAIIEQGTISRLIEAKPEELRAFIEEAAGISKYKERRRETENRVRHTQENLARLNDVRDELGKQIQRLQRQARTAERYKVLKEEERMVKAQLLGLRWRGLDARLADEGREIGRLENVYEGHMARQRELEAELARSREQQVQVTDAFNAVQGRFYAIGADVARIEQAIQHTRERREQLRHDEVRTAHALEEASRHLGADEMEWQLLGSQLEADQPALERLRSEQAARQEANNESERELADWQNAWEAFNLQAAEPARNAEVERTRILNLEQRVEEARRRADRLEAEQRQLDTRPLADEIEVLSADSAKIEERREALESEVRAAKARIQAQRKHNNELAEAVHRVRAHIQTSRGRLASLATLQEQALGKSDASIADWLAGRGEADAGRVAEHLTVDPGWERAVEVSLGRHLEAVCLDDMGGIAEHLHELDAGRLELLETKRAESAPAAAQGALAVKVQAPWPLGPLMAGIGVAEDLAEAMARRDTLLDHERLVTRDGYLLGRNWLRIDHVAEDKSGVLAREKEMRELNGHVARLEARMAELQSSQADGRKVLERLEGEVGDRQSQVAQAQREYAGIQSRLGALRARLEQAGNRSEAIAVEQEEVAAQREQDEEAIGEARSRLEEMLLLMEQHTRDGERLGEEQSRLRAAVAEARRHLRETRERVHELALRVEGTRTRRDSLGEGLTRTRAQVEELSARLEETRQAAVETEAPLAEAGADLEAKLARRMAIEAELRAARDEMEAVDAAIRDRNGERVGVEGQVEASRGSLQEARMARQATRVRLQTVREQLEEQGFSPDALLADLPESAAEPAWEEKVEEVERAVSRLGPINLAAIDEFAQQSERKAYLDAQHDDLFDALSTLENAMRKIDRETRTRFKETYDKINSGFKDMFPTLFGGGHAYLDLTSDELLETGVTVMARPPGKRNSTIHLLSGGEKALTAVALVFAIFQLNPAPFCFLDEVDAPLDDANVGRFCDLVRSMSDRVQFMFITHNKATMELSDHLLGVTMREPGVSRLVAVDVDAALEMAAG